MSALLRYVLLASMSAAGMDVGASTPSLEVSVEGAVSRPGPIQLPAGSRFADAVVAAMPRRDAYILGASAFRVATYTEHVRLRAGLLHDLRTIAEWADASPAVAARAAALHSWVEGLPVTGRVPIEGNPRRLEVSRGYRNSLLAQGDHFFFPERPDTVTVVGAVVAPCAIPHVAGRDARDYLSDCLIDRDAADPDTIHVIQPDGQASAIGVAAWNRSPAQLLAPGAIIYVPLRKKVTAEVAPELERDMTIFLASQPLPHDGLVNP